MTTLHLQFLLEEAKYDRARSALQYTTSLKDTSDEFWQAVVKCNEVDILLKIIQCYLSSREGFSIHVSCLDLIRKIQALPLSHVDLDHFLTIAAQFQETLDVLFTQDLLLKWCDAILQLNYTQKVWVSIPLKIKQSWMYDVIKTSELFFDNLCNVFLWCIHEAEIQELCVRLLLMDAKLVIRMFKRIVRCFENEC